MNIQSFPTSAYHPFSYQFPLCNQIWKMNLKQGISSVIELINAYINCKDDDIKYKNFPDNSFLQCIVEHFLIISEHFIKACNGGQIENLVEERNQMYQLIRLICEDFPNHCTWKILKNKSLSKWVHQFKWLMFGFDHHQYIEIFFNKNVGTDSKLSVKTVIKVNKCCLDLPREDFCALITSLIFKYYKRIEELVFEIQSDKYSTKIYSARSILKFLEQKNASVNELAIDIPCNINGVSNKVSQALLRNTFNFGQNGCFPAYIDFGFNDGSWQHVIKLRELYKKEYKRYTHDELYFALKFFDQHYQGDVKSLIEYQNVGKSLGFDKPGKKRINRCLNKEKFNEILSVFKRSDQKFKIEPSPITIFSHRSLKKVLKSDFNLSLLRSYVSIESSDSIVHEIIDLGSFFSVFYFSLDNTKKENFFSEIIKTQNSFLEDSYWVNRIRYKIDCSSVVIDQAINFWNSRLSFVQMNPKESIDLLFLFSRAQVECKKLEKDVKKDVAASDWKKLFVQWNVNYNKKCVINK